MATDSGPGAASDLAAAHGSDTEKLIALLRGLRRGSTLNNYDVALVHEAADALEAAEARERELAELTESRRERIDYLVSEVERLTEALAHISYMGDYCFEPHHFAKYADEALAAGGRAAGEEVK